MNIVRLSIVLNRRLTKKTHLLLPKMVERARISVGTRAKGDHDRLIQNPKGGKRRVRDKAVGTVVSAAGQHTWRVAFDFDGKEKECQTRSLRIVPGETGIPLNELSRDGRKGANANESEEPSENDAFNEEEDGDGDDCEDDMATDNEETKDEDLIPNNEFCFMKEGFEKFRSTRNDATRHRGRTM